MQTHGTAGNTATRRRRLLFSREKQGPPSERRPFDELVLLFASLFATALTRQRFLHTLFLARLEVKGVTFDLLDNVLLLDFALEASQGVL